MSEHNNKKFLSYSIENDPALATTTSNFDFRYVPLDHLERAIKKVKETSSNSTTNALNSEIPNCNRSQADCDVDEDVLHMHSSSMSKMGKLSQTEINELIELVGKSPSNGQNVRDDLYDLSETTSNDSYCNEEGNINNYQTYNILDCKLPKPQWVEIVEKPKSNTVIVDVMKTTKHKKSNVNLTDMEDYNESDYDNDTGNPQQYVIEDSDLEYEMIGRAHYTKYCAPRPKQDELQNLSNESDGPPEFIELEPNGEDYTLSFLKNTSPMRYTELTEDRKEEHSEEDQIAITIEHMKKMTVLPKTKTKPKDRRIEKKPEKQNFKKNASTKTKKTNVDLVPNPNLTRVKPKDVISPRSPQTSPTLPTPSRPRSRRVLPKTQHGVNPNIRSPTNSAKLRMRNIITNKSIEELKLQKIAIFHKMTTTQERMIEILDKLRLNLLELYVPDNSYDRSKRIKNAFEFSVRFSRNFLYPIRGMISDLRNTPVELLNSSASNESCIRVSSIFTLLYQSIITYNKQLRFFIIDKMPQKLNTLLEMIYTVTNICLEKRVFDRNDAIIERLQERCAKFLGFLEDLQEDREACERNRTNKTCTKYDLKMFMNDLNMYEPKLVLKKTAKKRISPKKGNSKSAHSQNEIPASPSELLLGPIEEPISTQVQNASTSVMDAILTSSKEILGNKGTCVDMEHLNKAILEALQLVTKEQVRQVLKPIIKTLGTALDKKNDTKTIEAILNAFNMKTNPNVTKSKSQNSTVKQKTEKTALNIENPTQSSSRIESQFDNGNYEIDNNSNNNNDNNNYNNKNNKNINNNYKNNDNDNNYNNNNNNNNNDSGSCKTSKSYKMLRNTKLFYKQKFCKDDSCSETTKSSKSKTTTVASTAPFAAVGAGDATDKLSNSKKRKPCKMFEKKKNSQTSNTVKKNHHELVVEDFNNLYDEDFKAAMNQSESTDYDDENDYQKKCQRKRIVKNSHQVIKSKSKNLPCVTPQPCSKDSHQQPNTITIEQSAFDSSDSESSDSYANAKQPPIRTVRSAAKPKNTHLRKKTNKLKKNILGSPPPPPMATPLNSARSDYTKSSLSGKKLVEDLLHSVANTYRTSEATGDHYKCKSEHKNNKVKSPKYISIGDGFQNCEKMLHQELLEEIRQKSIANENKITAIQQNRLISGVLSKCIIENDPDSDNDSSETNTTMEHAHQSDYYSEQTELPNSGISSNRNTLLVQNYSKNPLPLFIHESNCKAPDCRGSSNRPAKKHQQQKCHYQMQQHIAQSGELQHKIQAKQMDNHLQNCLLQQQQFRLSAKEYEELQLQFGLKSCPYGNSVNELAGKRSSHRCENQKYENKKIPSTSKNHHFVQFEENDDVLPKNINEGRKNEINFHSLIDTRNKFLALCSNNFLYKNPKYPAPWKVFTKFSNNLTNEIVNSVEKDFNVGVSNFIKEFLQQETKI